MLNETDPPSDPFEDVVEPALEDVEQFDDVPADETPNEKSEEEQDVDGGEPQKGVSLADLGRSFAKLLGGGRKKSAKTKDASLATDGNKPDGTSLSESDEDSFVVSPSSILESMLFVGHPENQPLTSRQLASLLRGVSPKEVDQLITDLNQQYSDEGVPYEIVPDGDGFRMQLNSEFAYVRERFYGRIREARLSQSAIDILAVVAYNQPCTRARVDEICQRPTGSVLSQLVRRQLLRVEQTTEKPRKKLFHTTDRFLKFFRIQSLEDLPRPQDTVDE